MSKNALALVDCNNREMCIRDSSIPYVVKEAEKLGYNIDRMAMSGGSAGGCLALIYAYRDADTSPVPVKMVFEGVGPSSFYPEDWKNYGLEDVYKRQGLTNGKHYN